MEQFFLMCKPDELRTIIREELSSLTKNKAKPEFKQNDDYLDINMASDFLKLSPHTLRRKAQKSEIPCYKRNNKWLFLRKELIDYVNKGKQLTYDNL
ncbi:helix-turn-helix domain-containing protein [Flavivirga abyssicola]|uniref:helix-turn-helix domain-containing protein n=1 Tax=Flavivirga abyssicola TaxID=3063533 RepID=UPI0026E0DE1D|nr:helix-turn-helix domain-containing protein [Flavivirga sp. MEBiC07777]WVK12725.1 helix-turn-helix domain-containing protein [Flavivirga sp. MEBiC07777]